MIGTTDVMDGAGTFNGGGHGIVGPLEVLLPEFT
jgi:hypothetical protein